MYDTFKFIHVLGVIILLGNVTITAFWKVLADRTHNPILISHANRGVVVADWIFTSTGIIMIILGGYGAAYSRDLPVLEIRWLLIGQLLFLVSGLIWAFILIPSQMRQSRAARSFAAGAEIDRDYRRDARSWLIWGIIATVPLVAATWIMIAKPA